MKSLDKNKTRAARRSPERCGRELLALSPALCVNPMCRPGRVGRKA